ncbi:MAG: hypothetical protein IJ515_02620 [Clostridia bacterium]|nr:hypothetical protein [Clostridia bacterium]
MTHLTLKKEKRRRGAYALVSSVAFTVIIFSCAIFLSDEMAMLVAEGLMLSVRVIIPSVFPFLLLSDFSMRFIRFEELRFFRTAFEKLFKINGAALSAWVIGIIGGFPIGARLSLMMYENGKISKCECERLIVFANNASPGYVICAVGIGMRGSLRDGALLYCAAVLSSIICGMILGIRKGKTHNTDLIPWQNYIFSESVKDAAAVCLNITGFITAFSIISGLLEKLFGNPYILAFIIPFLEVGNAAVYLSDLYILPEALTLALTGFALSFSGLCVTAQAAALIQRGSDISIKKYIWAKLLQGCISLLLLLFFCVFI